MPRPGFGMPQRAKGGWLQVWSTGLEKRPPGEKKPSGWLFACILICARSEEVGTRLSLCLSKDLQASGAFSGAASSTGHS